VRSDLRDDLFGCGFDGDEVRDACEIVCNLRAERDGRGFAGASQVMSGDFRSVVPESTGSRAPIAGFASFVLSVFGDFSAFEGGKENAANGFACGFGPGRFGDRDGDVAAGLEIVKHD